MMLIRFKPLALVFSILLMSWAARAELYLEPYIGYGTSRVSVSNQTSQLSILKTAYVGPALGAKFGFFYDYLYLTFDFQTTFYNVSDQNSDSHLGSSNFGFGIGWDWNIPIRTFFTLDTTATLKTSTGSISGTGSRIGLSYYLDINTIISLIMQSSKGSVTDATNGTTDMSLSTTMITFSFPLEFVYPRVSWKERAR